MSQTSAMPSGTLAQRPRPSTPHPSTSSNRPWQDLTELFTNLPLPQPLQCKQTRPRKRNAKYQIYTRAGGAIMTRTIRIFGEVCKFHRTRFSGGHISLTKCFPFLLLCSHRYQYRLSVPKKMVDEMTQTINNFPASYEPSAHVSHVSRSQPLESDKRAPGYVAWIPASSDKPLVSLTSKDLPSFPKLPPGPRSKSTLTPSGRRQSMPSMPSASRGTTTAFIGRRRSEVKMQERLTREVVVVEDEEVDIDTESEREGWTGREKGKLNAVIATSI
ncbi:hypothetical protein BC937DRAFT_93732 [Endogone sp. FLAS-F59071]|nr:hypothetical protein BC937DRAFT_93732 [Endogone sp. FLAS-F59071]|eukprot:RUS14494.1 hypothetical protein BC937DRAFT_93732 [Endogone sp. FLAS-F59071]